MTNNKTHHIIYLPLLFCSSVAMAAGQSASSPIEDQYREVNNANLNYVGGKTRVGIGIDTEFDGTAEISHIFSETKDTATSGDAWVGFDFGGKDSGVNAGGVRLNHHWVSRDAQGRPLRVNKIFGAYDRNSQHDDRATVGYGQEIDKGFWEAYVGKGLSGKRTIGTTTDGRTLSEKGYEYNVGGQVGTFLPGSNLRIRGGLDYAWDDERGVGESKPRQYTVSAGVEKFFQGTPHSVSLDVAASRNDGGYGKHNTDTRGNLSYHYDFGGADVYKSDTIARRVRVEVPGHSVPAKVVRKAIKVPYKQAYKKAYKVRACQLVKSTVELGSDTFFKANSSKLLPSAKKRLAEVIAQIRRTGYKGNIRITGNTCDIGSLKHNQALSERRARAVKRYMAAHGFAESDLVARGLGETHPKYPNTKGSRYKNRRVDIEYVTQDASCKEGYKTVYKTAYKTAYKTQYKNVTVQQAGVTKPSVTWKTEIVQGEPAWVTRGLHNSIRHNRHVSTYQTTAGSSSTPGGNSGNGNNLVLGNDTSVTTVNTPVTIDVLANDIGNGLSITSVTQPANGTASIVNGAIVFTPNQDFTGTDSFIYTVTDSNGAQSQATVTVTVNAAGGGNNGGGNGGSNTTPVAVDDNSSTPVNTPVTIDVLVNDTDADGDILTISSITQPQNGSAAISKGDLVYTPDNDFTGSDSFTYTITDGNGNTATATVTVTVTESGNGGNNGGSNGGNNGGNNNVAPIARDDQVTVTGESANIDVLSNDTDADGDTLSLVFIDQPAHGHASIINGVIVYTPNPGFSGQDVLWYTISDGNDHTSKAKLTITVENTAASNQPPVATDDYLGLVQVGQTQTISVLQNDSDPNGDTLKITSVSNTQYGTAKINSDGTISFTPIPDYCGIIEFDYTVSDSYGHTATATVHMQTELL